MLYQIQSNNFSQKTNDKLFICNCYTKMKKAARVIVASSFLPFSFSLLPTLHFQSRSISSQPILIKVEKSSPAAYAVGVLVAPAAFMIHGVHPSLVLRPTFASSHQPWAFHAQCFCCWLYVFLFLHQCLTFGFISSGVSFPRRYTVPWAGCRWSRLPSFLSGHTRLLLCVCSRVSPLLSQCR